MWRAGLLLFLLTAFWLQTAQQWRVAEQGTQGYLLGDWLISYAGGVVRRGLMGSLILSTTTSPQQALTGIFLIQTALYAVIFLVIARWVWVLDAPNRWAPLLISPAFIVVFGFNDFWGTHRKEVIAFAALLLLAEAVRSSQHVQTAAWVSTALFAVAVLSHEPAILLVAPFLLLIRTAVLRGALERNRGALVATVVLFICGVGVILALGFSGTERQQAEICQSLLIRGFDPQICSGAISFIGMGATEEAARVIASLPGKFLFVIPAILSTIPFLLVEWSRKNWHLLVLASIPLLPLFAVTDWGRWIMWSVTISTVLTVVHASLDGQVPDRLNMPLLILFVTTWYVPHHSPPTGSSRMWWAPFEALSKLRLLIS